MYAKRGVMECFFKVMMLSFTLWILVLGSVQGAIRFSITSLSSNASYCVLNKEPLVKVTCTITTPTTTSVTLSKDSTTYSDCDNTQDDCLPAVSGSVPRYSFTSDYTKNEFTFQIADVAIGMDEGTYACEEGGIGNSKQVSVCDPPENITITETGTEPFTVSATTDCVFPDTDVTFEWFYVPVSSNEEYALNATTTRSSDVAACTNGAKHVISSFEHTNAVENELEVFFRYKATHPSIATPVVQDTANTYLIKEPECCCCCCCCCICCFIVLIVSVAVGILFTGGHIGFTWADHKYSIKKKRFENNDTNTTTEAVCLKDYGIKAVLPECCICVVVIIVQIAVYFAALKKDCNEHCDDCNDNCDDCCGVFICLVVTIIVSVVKDAAESGIIYLVVHVKGRNYIHQGDDQQPSDRPRDEDDRYQSDEPKSNTTNSSSWRAQPPLPNIKSEKNTRGLSANIDDSDINPSYEKKRLTPIGQESQPGWEEKIDRSEDGKEKKKKRKSKDKERDSNVTESADL